MTANDHTPASVLIVDDHPVVRAGLRHLLEGDASLRVCCEAEDAREALRLLKLTTPDLMIVDLSLSHGSGLKLIKRIRSWNPAIKILVVSMYDEFLFAERVLHAGAMGYLHKREAADKVLEAVHQILRGKVYLSPPVINHLLLQDVGGATAQLAASPISKLSNRELEVFELIGQGQGTTQIAEQLHLSVKTVETHRAHIKKKLNRASSNDLMRKAVQWAMTI